MHGVLEVIESNHYYDVCKKEGLNYKNVIKAAISSKWVGCPMGRQYRVIYHKGYRGVGGKCFPKDLSAFIEYCDKKNIRSDLFKAAREFNKFLLSKQGLTEEDSENISSEEDLKVRKKK